MLLLYDVMIDKNTAACLFIPGSMLRQAQNPHAKKKELLPA